MNIGQAWTIVINIISAGRSGNYLLALTLAFQLIQAFIDAMPQASFSQPMQMRSFGDLDDVLNEMETLANSSTPSTAAVDGSLITVLLPLLQTAVSMLLKKWLGL